MQITCTIWPSVLSGLKQDTNWMHHIMSHSILGINNDSRDKMTLSLFISLLFHTQSTCTNWDYILWLIHNIIMPIRAQVTGKLVEHFQFSTLKDWQMKSIQATIEGRNSIIIQPTGSGKNLCFQLPPLITGRTTIVITPTISLMKYQTQCFS